VTHDPLAQMTQLLRGEIADHDYVATIPAGRDEAIAKLQQALHARAAQNRRRRFVSRLALAAGVIAVVGGGTLAARHYGASSELGRMRDPDVTAMRDGHAETLGAGARVAEGTELRTPPGGEAHLDFDSGTHVTLGADARLRLVEQSKKKRFSLETGSMFAKVAKLGADERFVVATPDAEIEVRGTAFRVSVVDGDPTCEGGTPTRLEVTEGTVVVRHAGSESRVTAGGRWPSCPARANVAVAAPPPVAPQTLAAAGSVPTVAPVPLPVPAPTAVATSSRLSEQNDMFERAMRAKRDGHTSQALAGFDAFLAKYPGSPLAEGAATERMRLLATTDPSRAASAARDYLKRWPRGVARAEAEGLAAASP
jgi:hypothetical protein